MRSSASDRSGVDSLPPLPVTLVLAVQHVLAMYAGAVAVPLVIGGGLIAAGRLNPGDLHHLIVADLFVSGLATIVQSVGLWRFGSRLPLVQGVSFAAAAPMITVGSDHGLPAMYGAVIATGVLMIAVAPVFSRLTRYFPPLVTGTIVMVVGLSLSGVVAGWVRGDDGDPLNVLLAVATVVVIVVHRFAPPTLRPVAVLAGLVGGTVLAQLLGRVSWEGVGGTAWFAVPQPFMFGVPQFLPGAVVTMAVCGLVVMTETSGDLVSVGRIVGRPVDRRTMADGLRADGLSTVLGGIVNTFPYTVFAQNIGLVSLSRVRSRFVVAAAGVLLVVLGLVPRAGAVVAALPQPVLGGAGMALFGMIVASGVRTLAAVEFTETKALVVGIAVMVSLLPTVVPGFFDAFPSWASMILGSGISLGAVVVVTLNILLVHDGMGPARVERLP
ncbi:nucleobase:cation symporter-2 family protein [Corynebacterium bovis]|uniref:Purine permease n=1 Tax=Corynebacterium bovis TaxID=36808 RepID=A0A3R8QLW8_9CORY|nr:nucleobase:cation symporter-2 family protein [Corynebacterium bovis]RRO93182.1 purine permease [Corynebacterium bovis]RRQ01878.1 purine permease [Corynebacterium bovis]RRQ05127.1 purine permease [Corynebacterium bovis]RRQ05689.1 purine permease [Corynebacterium bovis]RRQ08096.1 purine permease [Corynebacterium bovis]